MLVAMGMGTMFRLTGMIFRLKPEATPPLTATADTGTIRTKHPGPWPCR
jgi:hypothetical protein